MIDLVKDQLDAIPHTQLRRIVMPIATALQEANDLLELCRDERVSASLEEVGLAADFAGVLDVRIHAARAAQSAWIAVRDRAKPAGLAALEAEAAHLRRRMLAAGRFSLRDVREAQVALTSIRGGAGVDDLIQDLFDLAVVTEKYAGAFEADRTFDLDAHVAAARDVGRRLSDAVSEGRLGAEVAAARDLRDRAFTYMQDLILEIRLAGRYAYRDDAAVAARFASRHLRKRRHQTKKTTDRSDDDFMANVDGSDLPDPE